LTNNTDDIGAWSAHVLAATAPLREAVGRTYKTPKPASKQTVTDSTTTDNDISALLVAAEKLIELQASPGPHSHHDAVNIIGAIHGYAEILFEDKGMLQPAIASTLQAIITATSGAPSEHERPSGNPTAIATMQASIDPGVILAVDDMPENRDLVSRLLGKLGHTVITAESGEEALELLNTLAVDVVLLDLMMPGIGGEEVLRHLKDDDQLRATPVIMISGRQDMDQIVDCIELGADDYLLKPFNPVLLQARISAGIERKRWHDREERYREKLERSERFIRATFGRYLSDDIVDEILASPEGLELGGDLREVTIMMSDIRGFTTLSEHLPPQKIVQLLNRYLGKMTEIIMDFRGTIDEFLGDAVLAVFGAPRAGDDDAERAVECAIAMQQAMADINQQNVADDLPTLHMAIAINTGMVVAGNIGSERRSKYGFVGHEMNVTSRIEDVAKPGQILISASTLDKLHTHYDVEEGQLIRAKGLKGDVLVHAIRGQAGD